MKKLTGLLICIILLQHYSAMAQSFAINTDGSAAHASAILDVKSTTKGMLIPRMTKTERNSIVTPATGLMIFQTGPDSIGFHYYSGSSWSWVSSSSNGNEWKLTGNIGTNPATNFIGTLDNQPLRFRLNNIWAGEINTVNGCISLGQHSLSNNSGISNLAIGYQSMRYNSSGSLNTALGSVTLYNNSDGWSNTALGYYALSENFSGDYNTATGENALQKNTSGSQNTANGIFSLFENRTGNYNTAVGSSALKTNKYGSRNTAIGDSADVRDSSFNNATAIGAQSAVNCSNCLVLGSISGTNGATSNVNVGIGTTTPQALLHVKGGAVLFDNPVGNTPTSGAGTRMMWIPGKVAFRAGIVTGTQWDNVNIGDYSLAIGYNAMATGSISTAFGNSTIASGGQSTAIGSGSIASGGASTAIGNASLASGPNSFAIGMNNNASGTGSSAMGFGTKSKSAAGFTVGSYNDSTNAANPSAFDNLNRIFQIGNGTTDNFRSNAMTVLQNGNIGIGELNPTVLLNLASTLGDKISLYGTAANHYGFGIQNSLMQIYTEYSGADIAFGYGNSGAFTEKMRIKGNGNVGIGTSSPARMLSVATDIAVDENNTNSGTISNGLHFGASNSGEAIASNRVGGNLWGLDFYTNSVNRLSISNSGNVGIGTTAPGALLDVNGTTTTNALQVSNGTVITKMQSGSVIVGASASSQLIYLISFPVAFATSTPRVFASARNQPATNYGDAFSVSVRSVTANSVTLNIQRTDTNAAWAQNLVIDWFAVE